MVNVGLIDEHGVSNKECMIGFSVCGILRRIFAIKKELST